MDKECEGQIDLWSTHLPVLAAAVAKTQGPILELGCGHYSTRLLHALCDGRELITVDGNANFVEMMKPLISPFHQIVCVSDIAAWVASTLAAGDLPHFAFVFEDSGRAQLRPNNIAALRGHADFFVVNNTEPDPRSDARYRPVYRYETILPTFPHQWTYKRYPVWTSVVSDNPIPDWLERLT